MISVMHDNDHAAEDRRIDALVQLYLETGLFRQSAHQVLFFASRSSAPL